MDASWAAASVADDNAAAASPVAGQWAGERGAGVQGGGPRQGGSACRGERLRLAGWDEGLRQGAVDECHPQVEWGGQPQGVLAWWQVFPDERRAQAGSGGLPRDVPAWLAWCLVGVAEQPPVLWKASTDALQAWTAVLKVVLQGGSPVGMVVLQAARCGSV